MHFKIITGKNVYELKFQELRKLRQLMHEYNRTVEELKATVEFLIELEIGKDTDVNAARALGKYKKDREKLEAEAFQLARDIVQETRRLVEFVSDPTNNEPDYNYLKESVERAVANAKWTGYEGDRLFLEIAKELEM